MLQFVHIYYQGYSTGTRNRSDQNRYNLLIFEFSAWGNPRGAVSGLNLSQAHWKALLKYEFSTYIVDKSAHMFFLIY
ncbi:unnamed protein product [Rhizophagus irregularis]|uniref:Uncharacterized protein n=1 Tax=Rhizophagus irregularis TaxID=588596 RepID=A0A915ZLZ3_9GLOM|nr:unnamed protein product [Rhizophagus irregularis]